MTRLPRWAVLPALAAALVAAAACTSGDTKDADASVPSWSTFAGGLERTSFNANETIITKETAPRLVAKWKFAAGGPVASSVVVADVAIGGETVRVVIAGSFDGNVYAIDAEDGSEVWHFTVKPHPGASYGAIASSPTVTEVAGQQRVFIGGGMTMYALDAATGDRVWEFDAGTGCTDCGPSEERNEILSSPAVLPDEDLVLFGMDVNDSAPGKGGFYALSAEDGRLRWYFDVDTGATCEPDGGDDIRHFDGYHSAQQLGLPEDFFSTRDGCAFDRTETGCGNVWSPVSVDEDRIFFASSNCDTDDDPSSPEPPPPMSTHNEALVALNMDGTPQWTWRPREIDNDDLAFGAAPNLFTTVIDGKERDVVGIGNKDGTYYLLDRDGENELTGEIEPYWKRNLVPGGSIGGITGTPAVGEGKVFIGTAIGEEVAMFQTPSSWALDASTGEVLWSQEHAAPFFGPTSGVPGVAFMGGVDATMRAFDTDTGEVLISLRLEGLAFSQAAILDGVVYVGAGFGAASATSNDEAMRRARVPAAVWAFCVQGEVGCENVLPTPTP